VSALLALLLAAGPAAAASASKSEVTVGEVFVLEVKAEGPAGTTFAFPGEIVEEAYELRSQPAEPNADPNLHRYAAAVFALGEVEIAPIAVPYRGPDGQAGEVRTGSLKVKVASLLPKDPQEQKLADIRDPLGLGVGLLFWLALAGLASFLGLAGLVVAWLLWRRLRKEAVVAPALTPDAEARQALSALSRSDLRAFYIQLTEIAKRYLERRLGAPVLEMTSAETLAFLRDHPATGSLVTTVRDLTTAADAVKFARGQALDAEAERHLNAVRLLIDALEEKLRPAAPEGEAAA
jgi:hypothetical protein